MLGIRKGNTDLDIAPGSKLTVELASVLLNDSTELLGSYSYPVLLPYTDKNNAELGNAHLLENRLAREEAEVIIIAWGQPWKRARMLYNLGPGGYDADLQLDNGEFAQLISEKELPDIFTIYNNGVFADLIWLQIGHSNVEANAAVMDSCANPGKYPWVFFPLRNEKKFGGADATGHNFAEWDYINPWQYGSFFVLSTQESFNKKRYFTPFFYLTWTLKKVCEYLGFEATGPIFTDPAVQQLVIYNTGCIDNETMVNETGLKLAPARHLPKVKLNDFIKALRNPPFNFSVYFNGHTRQAIFGFKQDLLASREQVDVSYYVDPLQVKTTRNEIKQYKLTVKPDDGDELYKIFPYTSFYTIGPGKLPATQELSAGTLYMRIAGNPDEAGPPMWRTPWAQQLVNVYSARAQDTQAFNDPEQMQELSKNKFDFRVLAYKGMVADHAGNPYPYATSDSLDPHEADTYTTSCLPGGENGMLNRYCRDWFSFLLQTEKHTFSTRLPYSVLQQLQPLVKVGYHSQTKTLLPAIFDRVAFEEGDSQQRLFNAELTVYPHFNLTAVIPPVSTGFTDGSQSGPEPIYARLSEANRHNGNTGLFDPARSTYCDIVISFYRDAAMTIPRTVTNLLVGVWQHFRGIHSKFYRDELLFFTCNGQSQVLYSNKRIYWYYMAFGNKQLEQYSYDLDAATGKKNGFEIIAGTVGWTG